MKYTLLLLLCISLINQTFSQQVIKIAENKFITRFNNKYGVTDHSGKTVIPFVYDHIDYKNERLIVQKQNAYGVIKLDNTFVIPILYRYVLPRGKNRFILWTHNSLFGLCDQDGKIILPVKYQSLSSTEHDDFYLSRNDKKLNGVFDFKGKIILPEEYKFYTIDNRKVFAVKDGKPQILDLSHPEKTIFLDKDITFMDTHQHFSSGEKFYQIIKKRNKYGLINASNQVVIPVIYDEVRSSQHWRYFLIKKNNKMGIINIDGQIVREPIYDNIELRKEYVLLKRKNQKDESYSYVW